MRTNLAATNITSGFGIKSVVVDGQVLATVLKLNVKRNSLLHIAYREVFFESMVPLSENASVCKDSSMIRLYSMEVENESELLESELLKTYRRVQIRVREKEIAQLKEQIGSCWEEKTDEKTDELPF